MLLKLTCPACGRSDQASDRVIGKEIRCPCGAIFRVVGPKQSKQAAFPLPEPQPRQAAPQYTPPPREPETQSKPEPPTSTGDRYTSHSQGADRARSPERNPAR